LPVHLVPISDYHKHRNKKKEKLGHVPISVIPATQEAIYQSY